MNRKIVALSLLVLLLFVTSFHLRAQVPGAPKNIQSPNAAGLGLYGEVPVSQFTGVPNIEIPLYSFQEKQITVPVSLSYHAAGFRPDQHPGWVGTGWSLSAGGVISRTVKDVPDDYNNANYTSGANSGFYFNYAILNPANWDQISYMQSVAQNDNMLKDTEPDEFSFSFPGGSGKFYLDHTRTWRVKSSKPVKVVFNNQYLDAPFPAPAGTRMQTYGNTKSFAGFTLIDENGTQYVFGGTTNAIEYNIGFFSQDIEEWIAESWYLTKIINVQGYEINVVYERDDFVNQMYISIYNDLQTRTVSSGGVFNPQPSCNSWSYSAVDASYGGKLIAPVYLKTIQGPKNKMNFLRSTSTELRYSPTTYQYQYAQWEQSSSMANFLPCLSTNFDLNYPQCLDKLQWKKLDQVQIEDDGGNVIRSFTFTYNNNANERLKLVSLKEYGQGQAATLPPYQFFYDISQALPPYLANKTDHWGFYNGTYADISNISNYYNTYYGYREPNAAYLMAGTLNKIIYPTGGVTELTFEPHQYSKRLQYVRSQGIDPSFNTNTQAGGLRIKKIVSYDAENPDAKVSKEYFYVRDYLNSANVSTLSSSGVLGGQVKYYFDDYRSTAFNDNGIIYSKSIFSSQSVLPACSNSQGSHMGYSEVVEKNSDGSYTHYYFTNFENGHVDESAPSLQITRTAYEPYTSLEEERGQLLKEEKYSNTDVLLNKRQVEFVALNKANEYVRSMNARYFGVCSNTAVSCAEGIAYKNYVYAYLPATETTTFYHTNGQNPLSQVKTFTYDNQTRLLRTETVMDSKGLVNTTTYRYPGDFILSGTISNSVALGIKQLQTKNVTAWVVEKYTEQWLSPGNLMKTIEATFTRFSATQAVPVEHYGLETRESATGFAQTIISETSDSKDSRYKLQKVFDKFDSYGNLQQQHKNNDVNEVYLWGYNARYPVAKVVGSDYTTVMQHVTQSILDNPTDPQVLRENLNNLRVNIPQASVTTYTYAPSVGITSETDPRGRTTFYEYDEFQRLKLVKDHDGNIVKTFNYNYKQ